MQNGNYQDTAEVLELLGAQLSGNARIIFKGDAEYHGVPQWSEYHRKYPLAYIQPASEQDIEKSVRRQYFIRS
jgi:hypothetical protein